MDHEFLRRFIQGVSVSGMGTLSQMFLGFIGTMVIVRTLTGTDFGVYVLFLVIVSFYIMLSSLLLEYLSVTHLIAVANSIESKQSVTNTAITSKLAIDCILGCSILILRPFCEHLFKTEQLSSLSPLLPPFFLLTSMNGLLNHVLQGYHKYRLIAISQIFCGVIRFLLTVFFLLVVKTGLTGVIHASMLALAATILLQLLAVPVKKRLKVDSAVFHALFWFGFPLGLNNLLSFVFTRVDRFLIAALLSPLHVAYYEVATKIPECGQGVFQSFRSVLFPNMTELHAKHNKAEAEVLLNNSLRIISFLSLLATLILAAFQDQIVLTLFSDRYLESACAIPLLMVSLTIGFIGNILGTSLVAFGLQDKPARINVVDAMVNVAGNLLMIPAFGYMGAVYAALLARSATMPLNIWYLRKKGYYIRISDFIKPIVASTGCYLLYVLCRPEAFLYKCVFILTYVVTCGFFSIIRKDDIYGLCKGLKSAECN